jgi:AAA15 family ATPase/GTPase
LKIRSLFIRNFKAITKISFENIPDLIVLAGPNGCGKTSIFEAIRLIKAIIGPYHTSELPTIRSELQQNLKNLLRFNSPELEISMSIELSEDEIAYLREKHLDVDQELNTNNNILSSTIKIDQNGSISQPVNSPLFPLTFNAPLNEVGTFEYVPSSRDFNPVDIKGITISQE